MQTQLRIPPLRLGLPSRESLINRKVRNFLMLGFLTLLLMSGFISHAQTILVAGDVAVVGVNASTTDKFSLLLLKDITANTVISFTDNGFTGTNTTGRTGEGFLTYTAPSNQTAGTVLTWTNGMVITGTGWSGAAPTNFSFNAAGDQLFAFQGPTANWATQSGITLLFGMNYGTALSATSGAGNTLQPASSILSSNAFLNLQTATYANGYFANGSVSTTSVTLSGSATALLLLIADATKWYGNSAVASTFPTFSFTVTNGPTPTISSTGTLAALSTTYGTASSETSFSVSGTDMNAGILVTSPSGYEVSSTSGGTFTSTITIGTSGTISSTPVYVRLASTTIPGTYSGNIVLSSLGASTVNVSTTSSTVNQKQLTISGITANDKAFDGNTAAILSGTAVLNGVLSADLVNVTLGGSPVATFASSAVGTGIAVTVTGYNLTGSASTSYTLLPAAGLSANITSSGLLSQSITFIALANKMVTDPPFILTATASSGLAVSYTSSNPLVATVSGSTVTLVGAGSTNITASQTGNGSYLPAADVIQSLTVSTPFTGLAAGDIAVIGYNTSGSPDNIALLILKDLPEGTIFYVSDNELANSGSTAFTDLNEGEASFTVNPGQSVTAGTVVVLPWGATAVSTTTYTWSTTSGFGLGNNNEEIYVYTASSISSTTPTAFIYFAKVGSSVSSIPSSLVLGSTAISPSGSSLRYSTTGALYVACPLALLAAIGNTSTNWNSTGAISIAANDWAFTVTPVCGSISASGALSALSTIYGSASSETSFNVSGAGMTDGILVTPPSGFVVSLISGGTFTSTVTVGAAGSIPSTPVYVRLAATTIPGTYSGDIILSSTGALNVNIPTAASIVNQKEVTITGLLANNKTFDGNTSATLSGTAVLNGVLLADDANVTLGGTPTATFANAAVGTGIAVTVTGYLLTGSASAYYSLTQPTGLTANIDPTSLLNQTITFNALPNKTYGDAPFNLTATASSGLTVTYLSSNTSVATVSGNVVTVLSPGTTTITAKQAGNGTYNPAIDVTQTLVINPKQLTVTGAAAFTKVYDGTTDAVIFGSTLLGIVGSDIVTINEAGIFATANAGTNIAVTSTQILGGANASNYTVLLPTGLTADITQATQTITFDPLAGKSTTDLPFALTATASSGLTVTYTSSDPSVATVSGNTVTIVGAGNTMITVSQAGNGNFAAAANVVQTLFVNIPLAPGDIAVIGYNTSGIPDNMALLILKDLQEGTVFYVTDNEVATAGGSSFADLAEGEASFTVNAGQTIPAGTVVVLPWGSTAVTSTLYTWSTTSGFGLGNNNEEIYVYTASSITSTTPSSFIYYAKIGSSISSIPAGLTLGTTSIAPSGTALRYSTTGATYISCVPILLSAIGNTASNWNSIGASAIVDADWAFTVLPECPVLSAAGTLSVLSTTYGTASTETSFTVSGTGLSAGITVTSPTGYEVSLTSGGTFTSSLTAGGAGTVTLVPVYVRLASTTIPGMYSGDIVLSSLGATSVNVPTAISTVHQKALTITGLTANNKIFDGNTNATLSGTPVLNGILASDIGSVSISGTATGTFASASVGNNIPVSVSGYTLTGSSAPYYTITFPTLSANIDPTGLLNQTITFNVLPTGNYGNMPFNLSATASSGLSVSYNSSNLSVATIAGNVVTIVGVGTTTITATQAGNATYNPAIDMTQTLVINPKQLTVSGAAAYSKVYDGTTDAVIFGSTLVGIVGSDIVTINGTGTFATANAGSGITVTSTQILSGANSSNYIVLLPTGLTADITQASQTITFGALPNKTTADLPFALTATASSGLTVTYTSSNTAVATVSGSTVTLVGAGTTNITASQSGDGNYSAAVDVIQSLLVTALPTVTDIIMPQFIEGVNGTNANRIPFASYLTINNLIPGATYRYYTAVAIATDLPTSNGAGNPIFVSPLGFTKTTSASLATAGGYGTLIADAQGHYTGWFAIEPTGNASRFIPGNNVFIRINLNDGANGTVVVNRVTTTNSAKVLNLVASAGINNGTGLRGMSSATDKNFVLVYDNVNGTGRPLSASFVENDGSANVISYASFYASFVEGISGAYGIVIPNTNANGVQRIEQRSINDGSIVGCPSTDADGIWPSGVITVNPTGGTTAVVIEATDAPLLPTCGSVLNLTLFIEGYYDAAGFMKPVLFNQGEVSSATATDSITVELHDMNAPYATVAVVKTILNQDGTSVVNLPSVTGSYYIVVKHRNAVQTWSANPVVFGQSPVSYNFSDAASKAYGDNQIEVATGIWAFYSGDLVADENMDLLDLSVLETDINNFAFGYIATDINGDGNVDLLDTAPVEANINNFVFSNHP